jgi:hypothetical protein
MAMIESSLVRCVTAAVKESIVGKQVIADYLLYSLNRLGAWEGYVKAWGLESPTDDIDQLLQTVARKTGKKFATVHWVGNQALTAAGSLTLCSFVGARQVDGTYDPEVAASHFIKRFHAGELGRLTLDDIP